MRQLPKKQQLKLQAERTQQRLENARLASWAKWHDAYETHLRSLGFKIVKYGAVGRAERAYWVKIPSPESGYIRIELSGTRRDKCLDSYPITAVYQRRTWQEIQHVTQWCAKQEKNLSSLGLVKKRWRHWLGDWSDLFSMDRWRCLHNVWTWPHARPDEYLPHIRPPEKCGAYITLKIQDIDALVLRHDSSRYLREQKIHLPSAKLGSWEHRWQRHVEEYPQNESYEDKLLVYYRMESASIHLERFKRLWWSIPSLSAGDVNDTEQASRLKENKFRICISNSLPKLPQEVYGGSIISSKTLALAASVAFASVAAITAVVEVAAARAVGKIEVDPGPRVTSQLMKVFKVPGFLDGAHTEAFPDTGSDINIMNGVFARKRGYSIQTDPRYRTTIRDAGGTKIRTKGIVKVPWAFADKPDDEHFLTFHILSKCPHSVILGNPFLQATNTMHSNRITTQLVPDVGSWDVCSADTTVRSTQRMKGNVGGVNALALPDSGSRTNVMSLDFAEKNKFPIERSVENQRVLAFASGRKKRTVGQVTLPWVFDGDTIEHHLTFDVLQGATHDLILGQEIVYSTNAFKTHRQSLEHEPAHPGKERPPTPRKHPRSINYVGKPTSLHRLLSTKRADPLPPSPPPPLGAERAPGLRDELDRRARAQYDIDMLPDGPAKEAAVQKERDECCAYYARQRTADSSERSSSSNDAGSRGSVWQRLGIFSRVRLRRHAAR